MSRHYTGKRYSIIMSLSLEMGISCGSHIGRLKFDIFIVVLRLYIDLHTCLYIVGVVGYSTVYTAVKI